jgi:hypothetical protein
MAAAAPAAVPTLRPVQQEPSRRRTRRPPSTELGRLAGAGGRPGGWSRGESERAWAAGEGLLVMRVVYAERRASCVRAWNGRRCQLSVAFRNLLGGRRLAGGGPRRSIRGSSCLHVGRLRPYTCESGVPGRWVGPSRQRV